MKRINRKCLVLLLFQLCQVLWIVQCLQPVQLWLKSLLLLVSQMVNVRTSNYINLYTIIESFSVLFSVCFPEQWDLCLCWCWTWCKHQLCYNFENSGRNWRITITSGGYGCVCVVDDLTGIRYYYHYFHLLFVFNDCLNICRSATETTSQTHQDLRRMGSACKKIYKIRR